MTEHISPTKVELKSLEFEDKSVAITMLCNTCGWAKGTRSVVGAKDEAAGHIRRWHGSGTVEHKNFRMEVTQTGTKEGPT